MESPASNDGQNIISIAEICLCDETGRQIPREKWNVIFADSEETEGNHTADKLFDLQESTYWSTEKDSNTTNHIVVDLGAVYKIGAVRLLPRMEPGAPGSPARIRMYISGKPMIHDKKNGPGIV